MMSISRKSRRLLQLEHMLRGGVDVCLPELARKWNVSLRTLQRDIADLRAAGIAVRPVEKPGSRRIWRTENSTRRVEVRLDMTEWVLARLAVGAFTQPPGTGGQDAVSDASAGLLRKLDAAAGNRWDTGAKLLFREPFSRDFGVDGPVFQSVISGLLESRTLDIVYAGLRGDVRSHVLHPFSLVAYRGALHLVGRSESVRDGLPRVFAMDRITLCRVRREKAQVPPDWDPDAVVPFWGGLLRGKPQKITLRFLPSAIPQVQRLRLPETCRLTSAPGQCMDLTLQADINDELLDAIIAFGPSVRVMRPKNLQVLLQSRLHAILALYE